MPVSHPSLKRCMCEECVIKGGCDETGAPKGILMAERSIPVHIRRVKAERAEPAVVTSNLPACTLSGSNIAPSPICVLADDLRRMTLSPSKTSRKGAGEKVLKKERDRRTMKALDVLDNIDSRIQRSSRLLLGRGSINDVGRELALLRKATEAVSQRADIVISRKQAIITRIDDLAAQLARHKLSDDVLVPVEINTGKQ